MTYNWREPLETTVEEFVASLHAGNEAPNTEAGKLGVVIEGCLFCRDWWVTGNYFYATNSTKKDSTELNPLRPDVKIRFVLIN